MADELGNVCGVCELSVKNPRGHGWLCVNPFHPRKVEYSESCKDFEPKNRCKSCRYKDRKWYEEPCDSCTRAHDGYKPISE